MKLPTFETRKAGVSIGSLYQYFPGKDAIFSALVEREMEKNDAAFQAIIDQNRAAGREAVVEAVISFVVDFFYEKRTFFSAMLPEMMKLRRTRHVLIRRHETIGNLAKYLKENAHELRAPEQIDRDMYVISHSIAGVLQTAALEDFVHHPPEQLKPELVRLFNGYIFK